MDDNLREHSTTQDMLTMLQKVSKINPLPGTDIPGVVQDPADSYRQGHNHALDEVHETIFTGLGSLIAELLDTEDKTVRQDDLVAASYSEGYNQALAKVRGCHPGLHGKW